MQTEDIDVSARAILDDHKISLCPEARSGELSPADLLTLYRQRLRWLIGWDQVTFSMMKALLSKRNFNLRKAIGLYLLFLCVGSRSRSRFSSRASRPSSRSST